MANETPRINWRPPPMPISLATTTDDQTGRQDGLRRALLSVGVPEVENASTPKEDVLGLLMLAAEVEHALMVQYLYAAQSVRGIANRKISHIAVQEMGHLVTVNNLILSLTGLDGDDLPIGLHLGRDGIRKASSSNPLPFVLEPVSRLALAKFVIVERPGLIDDDQVRARVDALEAEIELSGVEPNPVYALYAAIRWIFQKSDTDSELSSELGLKPGWHLSDADFITPSPAAEFAAEPIEWGSVPGLIVSPVKDRASALHAIDEVAEQGEGASASDQSHFSDFLSILDSFEAAPMRVANLPTSPYVAALGVPEAAKAQEITDPYTVLWARLFSSAYELLLLDLGWGLSLPRSGGDRAKMIDVSVEMMRLVLQPISDHLSDLPLTEAAEQTAGPNYQLARETLPKTRAEYRERFQQVLTQRDDIISDIKSHPNYENDITGLLIFDGMQPVDDQRQEIMP